MIGDLTVTEITQIGTMLGMLVTAAASILGLFRIERVHKTTNSKMTKLLRLVRQQALDEGRRDAEDEAKLAADAEDAAP